MKRIKSFFLSLFAFFAFIPASWGQPYKDSGIVRLKEINESIKETMYHATLDSGPDVVHLPITSRAHGHAIVWVSINNRPYRFIFDTGCSRTIFNSRRVPMEPGDSIISFGNVSSPTLSQQYQGIITIDSIQLGEWKSGEYLLPIQDMGDPNSYYGYDGILGMAQLEEYDILFDWRGRLITLVKPHATDSVLSAQYDVRSSVPIIVSKEPRGYFVEPQVKSRFKKHQYKLILDTGSPISLIPEEAKPWLMNILPAKIASIGSEPIKVRYGHLRYKIGNKKYRHVTTVLVPDSFYTDIDNEHGLRGLLGMNVLKRQPFLLSVKNEQLVILKR